MEYCHHTEDLITSSHLAILTTTWSSKQPMTFDQGGQAEVDKPSCYSFLLLKTSKEKALIKVIFKCIMMA